MKILQVAQKPQRRGAEVFAFQLSNALRRHDHNVRIAYLYPFDDECSLPIHQEDRVLAGRETHLLEKLAGVHPGLLRSLLSVIREFRPDVVQVNGGRAVKYGAAARFADNSAAWALIYRNIGNPIDWVRGVNRLFYKNVVMPQLDGVVGVSRATLDTVKDFYGLSIPMAQIPRAVDPSSLIPSENRESVRRRVNTPSAVPVVLFIGSFTREKRLDRFLRVFARALARVPQAQAWLIGDGPLRPEVEQQAARLQILSSVHFLGAQAAVADYIAAADLLMLTSDTEGIPGVILEAGLLGLPSVATRVGGVAECVLDGETGLVVDPQDEAGLSDALSALLQDATRRKEMGAKARDRVKKNFSLNEVMHRYVDFYREVLSLKGGEKSAA